ncbi:hypothetical protein DOS58_09295 [Staphylococcus felis]|nr:hypothetical protein DOS61_01440 [Staphylococcus felis]REH88171.1 hypothetical protein DOS58_09295 [Staphylococcus felis]
MINRRTYELMSNRNRQNFGAHKENRYAIRKFNIGIASVLFGATVLLSMTHEAKAAETNTSLTQKSEIAPSINELSNHNEQKTASPMPVETESEKVGSDTLETPIDNKHKDQEDITAQADTLKVESVSNSLNDIATNTPSDDVIHEGQENTNNETKQLENATVKQNSFRSVANNAVDHPSPSPEAKTTQIEVEGIEETVYRKEVPVLQGSKVAQTLGMNRGLGQGRESLGIILPENAKLYIRQAKEQNESDLRVSLMTNDGQFNKNEVVPKSGEWVAISTGLDSAAFVYLPRGLDNPPLIDFYVEHNNMKALPTYRRGQSQEAFETQWVDQDSSYAYVDGTYNALLIPRVDRDRILNMKNQQGDTAFRNLDEMIDYYDDIIQKYNKWVGLNDNPNSVDFNLGQKYFTVANQNGYGLAYWSWDHMGSNDQSIHSYLTKGWLALHEVGHGFDGWLTDDPKMPLLEVWNNILANEYQMNVEKEEKGWLYQGDQEGFQRYVQDELLDKEVYRHINEFSLKERLDFMTRIVRLTTIEGLTEMLQKLRVESSKNSLSIDMPAWVGEYWLANRGYNGLAYFDLFKIDTPQYLEERLNAYTHSYIYPLAMLIEDEAERQKYVEKLGLATIYELVKSSDIADTQVTAPATIRLSLNGHTLPNGSKVQLLDGTVKVAEAIVENGVAKFDQIRAGVYKVVAPLTEALALPAHAYLVVRENRNNEKTLDYSQIDITQKAISQKVSLQGLSNWEFATVSYDPSTKQVQYRQNKGQPHLHFNDEYAHVTIKKQDGTVVFDQSFIGNDEGSSVSNDYTLEYSDQIIVKHREPSRRQIKRIETGEEMSLPESGKETVTYTLTEKGFKVIDETMENVETRYTETIKNDIHTLIEKINAAPSNDYRTQLYRLVQDVSEVSSEIEKEALMAQLEPYLDKQVVTPLTVKPIEYNNQVISGQTSNQASVQVTLPSGEVLNTQADETGAFTINVSKSQTLALNDTVQVVATKESETSSQVESIKVTDTISPESPVIFPTQAGSKEVKGSAEPNTILEFRFQNGTIVTTDVLDNGTWTIKVPETLNLEYNDQIIAKTIDKAGNVSELTFKNVIDTIRPVRPVVTNTEAGSHIIWGYGETYKDEIHVRLPNNRLVSTKVGRNGTWMIGVPWDITLNVGNRVYVFEVDKAGNYSLPGIGRIVDTKAPEAPKVDEVTSESENIKGIAEPNSTVTVIFPDGTTNEVTVNEAGEFTANIPIDLAGGEKIQIKATDQSTNESPVTEVTVKAIVISEEPVEDPGKNETEEELAENSGKDETTEEPVEGSGENETAEEPVEDSGVDKTEEELAENSGKDETTEEPVEGSGENETAEEPVENSEVDEIAEEPIENSEEAETPEDDQKAEVDHNPELTQSIIDKQEANPKPLTEEMTRVDPSNIEAKTMISLQQSELLSQSIPKEPSGKTNIIIQAKVVGKDKDNHNSRDTILPNTGTSTDNTRTGWIMSLFGFGVLAHFYRRKQKDTTQS